MMMLLLNWSFGYVFKCRFYAITLLEIYLPGSRQRVIFMPISPTLISPNISFPALFHRDHQPLTSNAIQSAILPIGQRVIHSGFTFGLISAAIVGKQTNSTLKR